MADVLFWINWIPGIMMLFSSLAMIMKPKWSAAIAMSGLAYPILLAWEILLLLIMLFLLNKKIWQPAVFILVSWFSLANFISFGDRSVPLNRDELVEVASWNARFFDPSFEDISEDLDAEAYQYIRSIQADIMAFQEYRPRAEIKLDKAFKYVYESGHFAMASNFPFGQTGYHKFDQDISYGGNGFQWADIRIKGEYYRFYNIHLSSIRLSRSELDLVDNPSDIKDQDELKGRSQKLYQLLKQAFVFRQQQQAVLLEHMKQSPFPVILMGDINDSPNSHSAHLFRKTFKDCWFESGRGIGKTYIHPILPYRIDYIYVPEDVRSYQTRVHKRKLSDHYALSTSLQFGS